MAEGEESLEGGSYVDGVICNDVGGFRHLFRSAEIANGCEGSHEWTCSLTGYHLILLRAIIELGVFYKELNT